MGRIHTNNKLDRNGCGKNLKTTVVSNILLCFFLFFVSAPTSFAAPTQTTKQPTKQVTKQTSKSAHKNVTQKKITTQKSPRKSNKKVTVATHKVTKSKIHHPVARRQFSATSINRVALLNSVETTTDAVPPLSIKQRLVNFVHKTISSLHYSTYKLGGSYFDTVKGIYILDCSRYVGRLLQAMYPHAYSSLVNAAQVDKPTTQHYYDFFTKLSNYPTHYWDKIEDVDELETGDILVFRYKNSIGHETGGHVMIVMSKPLRDENIFLVPVTDSAASGHSQDTRLPRTSGIGIGTVLLKIDPKTEQPYAFAWRAGSRWTSNVSFAMARPIDIYS